MKPLTKWKRNPDRCDAYFIIGPDVFVICNVSYSLWFIYSNLWKIEWSKDQIVYVHVFPFPFVCVGVGMNIYTAMCVCLPHGCVYTNWFDFIELTSFEGTPAGFAVCFWAVI